MKRIFYFIILAWLTAAAISCQKEKPQPALANISIQIEVQDNSVPVTNALVFLKASAIEFPGANTTVYDRSDTVSSVGTVTLDSLFRGNYYLYSAGFDGTDSVFGSKAIVLTEANDNQLIEIRLDVSK
ncbi:MAG TPA: hypothetical protein EYN51_11875 [Flavobacteriales bacterium]|nr:hypothetical protein [Flavobacteriales bacterium]HIA10701.1 hypothetical protein [Flavobacteriales bacterium]